MFGSDTLAFANQTYWIYQEDPDTGKMTHVDREPRPDFAHRCFPVIGATKKFLLHAQFEPDQPAVDEAAYRRLVEKVLARSDRSASAPVERVVIPGYADLHTFSQAHEPLFKEEIGGAWRSYLQRGNWRMIFPFSRSHQNRVADEFAARLAKTPGAIAVHLVTFPELRINHAALLFEVDSTPEHHHFSAYDPNEPQRPVELRFDRKSRQFLFPETPYYQGGPVDVYEIYESFWY